MNEQKQPEVGDVWGDAFEKYYIEAIDILGEKNKKMVRTVKRVNEKYVVQRQYFQENFIEDYRYLGKSKAKIEDLFEIEEQHNESK